MVLELQGKISFYFTLAVLFFLSISDGGAQPLTNFRTKIFAADTGIIHIDSLSLVPGSVIVEISSW